MPFQHQINRLLRYEFSYCYDLHIVIYQLLGKRKGWISSSSIESDKIIEGTLECLSVSLVKRVEIVDYY